MTQKDLEDMVVKFTPNSFEQYINRIVIEKDISYLEAVSIFYEETEYDAESIRKLINKELKARLEIEAEQLNLLQASDSNRLLEFF